MRIRAVAAIVLACCGLAGACGGAHIYSEESWETVISALVDPLWLEEQTEAVLGQIFGLFIGEGIPNSIAISLQEIKDRVDSDAGYEAIIDVMQAQPDCTLEQVAAVGGVAGAGHGSLGQ